ncbi:MAG TPA: hypothetical protein VKR22_01625 [Acidimicrobiales bacterium]|nr:hypothetical protein [Acidimicrobiales bacterium]
MNIDRLAAGDMDALDEWRRERDAAADPEWLARYGEESWKAALVASGFCGPADVDQIVADQDKRLA